jgi:hypothetical protein
MSTKTKAHQRYKNQNGDIVPGVTTVLGLLAKPALIVWANRLGLQGIDSTKYRDEKAEIGSLAHAMILADLKGEKVETSDYSQEQINQAENCYLSWLEWRKGKKLEPIVVETPLVNEAYQFGGCPDFYGRINGELVLGDYKTGGIWDESYYQTCAYATLLTSNGYDLPEKIIILGIPRTEDEKFQEVTYTNFDKGWEIFTSLLRVYQLQKEIKRGK